MDQMTAACGEQDALLALRCQPAELEAPVTLPADLEVWGIDSGIRHAVTGADYGSVRVGAFMGYRVIADLAGLAVHPAHTQTSEHDPAPPMRIDDPHWHGYLANIPPSMWEQHYRDRVPESLDGAAFLARYAGTTDMVTRVNPSRAYAVRQPTAHPIYEHHRVRLFRALLKSLATGTGDRETGRQGDIGRTPLLRSSAEEETCRLLGELMYQSHASYSACGLGSDGTDRLVELVRAAGPASGLYGAKITGGGSGGTVAILAQRGASAAVHEVAARYEQDTGRASALLSGSSPGAKAFGVVWLAAD
jgi:L-arabinokinase